jgi:hypothetical protein
MYFMKLFVYELSDSWLIVEWATGLISTVPVFTTLNQLLLTHREPLLSHYSDTASQNRGTVATFWTGESRLVFSSHGAHSGLLAVTLPHFNPPHQRRGVPMVRWSSGGIAARIRSGLLQAPATLLPFLPSDIVWTQREEKNLLPLADPCEHGNEASQVGLCCTESLTCQLSWLRISMVSQSLIHLPRQYFTSGHDQFHPHPLHLTTLTTPPFWASDSMTSQTCTYARERPVEINGKLETVLQESYSL